MSLLETLPETNRTWRGHRFYGEDVLSAPPLYATEDIEREDKEVVAHFFLGSSNWWIIEVNPEDGIAFGFCLLNGDWHNAELGYVSLIELEGIRIHGMLLVERDLSWERCPLSKVLEQADG